MKKKYLYLFLIAFICQSLAAQDSQGIPVNEKNFPDSEFRAWVEFRDLNRDKILTPDEIEKVTTIDVSHFSYTKMKNMKGIEYFTAATYLNVVGQALTSLDVSALTHLEIFFCDQNQLTSLDVSQNKELKKLYCGNNQISQLDMSQNNNLTLLACNSNNLKSLNLSNCTSLTQVVSYANPIESLVYNQLPELREIDFGQLRITSMDFSAFPNLRTLRIDESAIKKMDLSVCREIESVNVNEGSLEELDISGCQKLTFLTCNGNNLSVLEIPENCKLSSLECSRNQLTELDLSSCSQILQLQCSNNLLTSLKFPRTMGKAFCERNAIKKDEVDRILMNLPERIWQNGYIMFYGEGDDIDKNKKGWKPTDYNEMTYEQVCEAESKGWPIKANINGKEVSFTGNYYGPDIDNKCAAPTIQYLDGKLVCTSATEGAKCTTTILAPDQGTYMDSEIPLKALYSISVIAKKDGFDDSDIVTATLYWMEKELEVGVDDVQANARPIIISNTGNTLTVQGAEDGESITAYTLDGKLLGSTVCRNGQANLPLGTTQTEIVIIKVGEKAVKVRVR